MVEVNANTIGKESKPDCSMFAPELESCRAYSCKMKGFMDSTANNAKTERPPKIDVDIVHNGNIDFKLANHTVKD